MKKLERTAKQQTLGREKTSLLFGLNEKRKEREAASAKEGREKKVPRSPRKRGKEAFGKERKEEGKGKRERERA